MSTDAIVMMVVAMLILWGGLALAILHLGRGDAAAERADGPSHRDL